MGVRTSVLRVICLFLVFLKIYSHSKMVEKEGAMSLCTLSLGVGTDFWLYTDESKSLGNTSGSFTMRSGLWRMCIILEDYPAECYLIDYFKQDAERQDDATITMSITRAIRISAPMQVGALVFVVIGFTLGVIGGLRRDSRTIAAAVMYIFSGLLVAMGMILYISSINDEEGHGIKSKDGSAFAYRYGWSFIFVGVSFVCSELAAVISISVHISLNSRRGDILKIIPGLEDKLQVQLYTYGDPEPDEELEPRLPRAATPIY